MGGHQKYCSLLDAIITCQSSAATLANTLSSHLIRGYARAEGFKSCLATTVLVVLVLLGVHTAYELCVSNEERIAVTNTR